MGDMNIDTFKSRPRTRVNAATLPMLNGRPVILLGVIKQVDSSRQNITVQTSDNQTVAVRLDEPLLKEPDGIFEFHGISQGSRMISKFHIELPCNSIDDFDMNSYDEAIKIIHSLKKSPWLFE